MVKYSTRLDAAFAALADPTRRAMIDRLARGDASVGELARPFRISPPAISKHLRVLERAGLMTQRKRGRVRLCVVRPEPLRAVSKWVEQYRRFWTDQLDALADFLETAPPQPSGRRRHSKRKDKP